MPLVYFKKEMLDTDRGDIDGPGSNQLEAVLGLIKSGSPNPLALESEIVRSGNISWSDQVQTKQTRHKSTHSNSNVLISMFQIFQVSKIPIPMLHLFPIKYCDRCNGG